MWSQFITSAFFLIAQALLRLIGEPVIFLDKESIKTFKAVAGSSVSIGPGVFEFRQTASPTLSVSEYILVRKDRRPHEATWKKLLHLFDTLINDKVLATDATETAIFASLATQKLFKIYSDYDWPSHVRHCANYNPGFAYLLAEGRNAAKTKRHFQRWQGVEEQHIESLLRSTVDRCICSGLHRVL